MSTSQKSKLRKRVLRSSRFRASCHSRASARTPRISRPRGALPASCDPHARLHAERAIARLTTMRLATTSPHPTQSSPRLLALAGSRSAEGFFLKPIARRRSKRTCNAPTTDTQALALHRRRLRQSAVRTRERADLFVVWLRTTRVRRLAAARTSAARARETLAARRRATKRHALQNASQSHSTLLRVREQQRRRERAALLTSRIHTTRARRQLVAERSRAERARKLRARKRSRKRRRLTVARRTSTELKMTAAKRFAVMMWGPAALNEPEYSQSWP